MEEDKSMHEPESGDILFSEEPIQAIRQRFNYLTELWLFKDIDDQKYERELARMVLSDGEGRLWFISPLNGNWYVMEGEEAVPGEPPPTLYRPPRALLEKAEEGYVPPSRPAAQDAAAATTAGPPTIPAPATADSPAASMATPTVGERRFCTHCGSMMREGAKFCRDCGTAVKGREDGA